MRINLSVDDCYCGISQFYKNVAKKMGVAVTDNTYFNCTKICVTKSVRDELWAYYYYEEGYTNLQINALFLGIGPKANLACQELYSAEVEDGFVTY